MCIDGWIEGDIALDGGTLQVDDDFTISSSSTISLLSSSTIKLVDGSSLTYEGDSISLGENSLSLNGEGSLILNDGGTNAVTLNCEGGELEFAGDETITVSHVKTSSGDSSSAPSIKMTSSGVVENLAHENFLEINFLNGKNLTLSNSFEIPSGKEMKILGEAGKTISEADRDRVTRIVGSLGRLTDRETLKLALIAI